MSRGRFEQYVCFGATVVFGWLLAVFSMEQSYLESRIGEFGVLLLLVSSLCITFIFLYYLIRTGMDDASGAWRSSLSQGGGPAVIYSSWLHRALRATDLFMGDPPVVNRTYSHRIFGLETPPPLWTASAFHRCLTLTLICPLFAIVFFWVISGDVGPAESALGLSSDIWWPYRQFFIWLPAFFGLLIFWMLSPWSKGTTSWKGCVFALILLSAPVFFSFKTGALAGTAVIASLVAFRIFLMIASTDGVIGDGFPINRDFRTVPFTVADFEVGAIFGCFVAIEWTPKSETFGALLASGDFLVAVLLHRIFDLFKSRGIFYIFFLLFLAVVCIGATLNLALLPSWKKIGPLVLFFCLLPILMVPFDWVSLGLTRALLHRGLERRGWWWPYTYAVIDATLAVVLMLIASLVLVVGIQSFELIAVHAGGSESVTLDLADLFNGFHTDPGAPRYWWVYVLLLPTVVPSLFNLCVAGCSFVRGVPGISAHLVGLIPKNKPIPARVRLVLAVGFTGQTVIGLGLALVAQGFFIWGIILWVIPRLGFTILSLAQATEGLHLPDQVLRLFTSV